MKPETAALDHICNVIRRQVQEEYKDLTLFFIVHAQGQRVKALTARRAELCRHAGGAALYARLQEMAATEAERSFFAGMIIERGKSRIPFFMRKNMMGAFFVNTEDFESDENPRPDLYHLAWHAVDLADHYKKQNTDHYILDGSVLTASPDTLKTARRNMLADAFSASMLALQGQKSFFRKLARKRCLMALQPVRAYHAELYPYPVTADAAPLVYEEVLETLKSKTSIVRQATLITHEIGLTYDDTALRQWQDFALAAQEMAWLGSDKSRILGTAIYMNEDPYVRAMAYLVSEVLNLKPAALANPGMQSSFVEAEANERLHLKKCEENFAFLLEKASEIPISLLFLNEARRHNRRLLDGETAGWCAAALLKLAETHTPPERLRPDFQEELKKVPWTVLSDLSLVLMRARREGMEMTPQVLEDLCKEDERFALIVNAVKKAAWE